jgi:hypothetical protein
VNLATIWVAEQGLHVNLKIGVYENHPTVDEETAWGRILAGMVRQVASGIVSHTSSQEPPENVVNRIWTAFHEELSKPAQPG